MHQNQKISLTGSVTMISSNDAKTKSENVSQTLPGKLQVFKFKQSG
jgi:hypothetical protein